MSSLRQHAPTHGNPSMKRQITYAIGKDRQRVYNVNLEELIEGYIMANNVPLLAADDADILARQHTLIKNFTHGDQIARDFDISFTVGESSEPIAAVRLKESAARKLYEDLGEKLDHPKVDV